METIQRKEDFPGWRFYGKRYLRVDEFKMFCTAVGLYNSHEWELEEFERSALMFPATRLVMPDEYARAIWLYFHGHMPSVEVDPALEDIHRLDWALRYPVIHQPDPQNPDAGLHHPIDLAWGKVVGLVSPTAQAYVAWNHYQVQVEFNGRNFPQDTATHFYHYWQVYEFFQARKISRQMYGDPAPVALPDIQTLRPGLQAMSYFQHLYRGKLAQLLDGNQPDDDNQWRLSVAQQQEANASAAHYAQETLQKFTLDEKGLYEGLRGMMILHAAYETLERYRLAETLKSDIWRMVEWIYFAFGTATDQIFKNAGSIVGRNGNYLELLFPNQRERSKIRAARLLNNLAEEHNRHAPGNSMTPQAIEELIAYLENSELALFLYILERTNQAHFASHSWQAAEVFLLLKSLASCPESLMKVLLLGSNDQAVIAQFTGVPNPGMGTLNGLYFQNPMPGVWAQYNTSGHRSSRNAAEFAANLGALIPSIITAQSEDEYLGHSLSLATCIRNFTSHLVLEKPDLLQGQYVRCVRAITSALFMAWQEAKRRNWV